MVKIQIPWPELPQEVRDELLTVMRDKLPDVVDDAILNDIIDTNMQIVREYLQSV